MAKSAYLIQGDSLFLSEKTSALLKSLEKTGTLETETCRLAEVPLAEVLAKARNKPFFVQTQVFFSPDADELNPEDLDLLAAYLAGPPEYSVLIFHWNEDGKEPYARVSETLKRLGDVVKNAGGAVEITASQGAETAQAFIRAKLKTAGKTLTPQAQRKLELLGQDFPALLDSVLENLILAAGSSSEITQAMADAFDEDKARGNRFKLLDAILGRKPGEALAVFFRLIDSGEDDPVMLMAFLHGQFRLYWQAQLLFGRGAVESRIFEELKISSKRAHFFSRQMRLFSRPQLERALETLFELDRGIKSGEEEMQTGLEKWIARTAGMQPAARAMSKR